MTTLLALLFLLLLVGGLFALAYDWRRDDPPSLVRGIDPDDVQLVTYGPYDDLTDSHGSFIERVERDQFKRQVRGDTTDDSP